MKSKVDGKVNMKNIYIKIINTKQIIVRKMRIETMILIG